MTEPIPFLDRSKWIRPIEELRCPITPANQNTIFTGVVKDYFWEPQNDLTPEEIRIIAAQIRPLIDAAKGVLDVELVQIADWSCLTLERI